MPYNYGNYYGNNNGYQMNNAQYGYQNQMQQPQMSYQQPQPMNYQQQAYQMAPQAPQGNQSIIWVQGEAGAKAYPVAAGQSVLLMDSEDAVLYVKSTDQTGRPLPMESYDLVRRESVVNVPQISQKGQNSQMVDTNEFVKMSDLETKVSEMVSKAVNKALNE